MIITLVIISESKETLFQTGQAKHKRLNTTATVPFFKYAVEPNTTDKQTYRNIVILS